jgi:large subunit ribosomal protein L10
MKTRETKQKDLAALTDSLQNSTSAMVVGFSKLSVTKDQEFRNSLREAGAEYKVVKNTLARIAVKGTPFEPATDHFKGVTAIAWTQNDPVILTKAISKFMKENADTYTFKTGVLDGRLLNLGQVTEIASLPSKEELISKLLYVLNAQAQRIVTVINAVPRDLAVVIKQIGEQEGRATGAPTAAAPAEEAPANAAATEEETAAPAEVSAPEGVTGESAPEAQAVAPSEAAAEEASAPEEGGANGSEAVQTEAASEANSQAPDDAAEQSINSEPAEGLAEASDDKSEDVINDGVAPTTEGDQ